MITKEILIENIPAIVWGKPSDHVYIFVHGKMSCKEEARAFAEIADEKGMQTLSFDLADHGARKGRGEECEVLSGIRDLQAIDEYARARWDRFSLFACSLGAYFSLNAYRDRAFENCLFQSPIVDMEALIGRMFLWSGVTEERLALEKKIETPLDTLSWDYYQYVKSHPIVKWTPKTHILYASRDQLQSLAEQRAFADQFGAELTVAEGSDHPFMEETDAPIVRNWMRSAL